MAHIPKILIGPIALVVLTSGCDDRSSEVAREAAARQAQQNTVMAELHGKVAHGTEQLVAADAESRKEFVKVHHDLQAERGRLDSGWKALESERQSIARERRWESLLAPIASGLGGVLLVSMLLGFCWYALAANCASDDAAQFHEMFLSEVLLTDSPLHVDAGSTSKRLGPDAGQSKLLS